MKITIATLLLVLGFFVNTFSQEPDLAKIKAMPDDTLKVASLYEAAEFHVNKNNNLTDSLAQEILALSVKLNYIYGKAKAYYYLGKIAKYKSDFPKSLDQFNLSKTYFEEAGNSDEVYRTKAEIASVKLKQGEFDEVTKIGNDIIAYAEKTNNEKLKFLAVNQIAIAYQKQGNNNEAFKYYLQRTEYDEKINDKRYLALDYNNIGITLKNIGKYSQALEYHFKALAIRKELNLESGIAMSLGNIAVVYNSSGNYLKAIEYLNESLKINTRLEDKSAMTNDLSNLGISYQRLKNYDKALFYYQKTLDIDIAIGQKYLIAEDYLNIASVYFDLGNYPACVEYLDKSEPISLEHKLMDSLQKISKFRSDIAKLQKNDKVALEELQTSIKIKDSIFNLDISKQMQTLLIEYESEKKDKQIAKSNFELKQKELEIELKNSRNNLLSVGLVALIILILVTFGFFVQKRKSTAKQNELDNQLALEKVRVALAADLHDDIGSTLSSISIYSEALKNSFNAGEHDKAIKLAANIGSSARETMDNMSDIVWAINPLHDELQKLVGRMQTFANTLLAQKGITTHFSIDEKLFEVKVPMLARKNIFLIFKEAINNIAKYAYCKNVRINLTGSAKELNLIIADDGKGFDMASTTDGNGLRNMQLRAKESHGNLEIDTSNIGTTISLKIVLDGSNIS